jgi:hypothetical protein
MAYRDTFTVTSKKTGSGYTAKLHGYPFHFEGATIQECLSHAGKAMDEAEVLKSNFGGRRDEAMAEKGEG